MVVVMVWDVAIVEAAGVVDAAVVVEGGLLPGPPHDCAGRFRESLHPLIV